MTARSIISKKDCYAAEYGEHDLIAILKEVILSLDGLCQQKTQSIYLDSCPSKMMSLDKDMMFVLARKLLTNISLVACKGAMIKLSVFNCESEILMLVEYGAKSHYQRKNQKPANKELSSDTVNPFTSSPGLDLIQIKNLAEQLSWNVWTGGSVKNRGTRVFLSTPL